MPSMKKYMVPIVIVLVGLVAYFAFPFLISRSNTPLEEYASSSREECDEYGCSVIEAASISLLGVELFMHYE